MALLGGYQDSGVEETYPRKRMSVTGAGSAPTASASLPGGTAGPPVPTPAPSPAPTQDTPKPTYGLSGFDQTKLADPTHNTFKYQFGRIAQGYNPQQGIQSGMLDELNKLGFANFYGSGQRLGFRGVTDAGKAAGLDPHDFEGDFIRQWQGGQNPNALWNYDWWAPPEQQAGAMPGFESLFQQPPMQMPSITMNSGIDPQALMALMATYGGQQTQPVSAPGYMPSAPQTQAAPMAPGAAPSYGGSPVQTSAIAQQASGMDPFMAWLRQMWMGGGAQ